MKKVINDLVVVRNKRLNDDYFILKLLSNEELTQVLPGQFVEVFVENSATFLRRPISIHDVDNNDNTISLLIRIVGEGTKKLAYLEEGDLLNIIYPLGNGFTLKDGNAPLLIGGGCGVAPLLYLAKYLKNNNVFPTILIGGRTKDDILEIDEYKKYGEVFVTTEDGSIGEKGFVTQHSKMVKDISSFDKIYTCGPEPMMKAVAKIAMKNNIDCEVSLENMMACGVGACLCCVTETTEGNKCVCTEGPVFNIKDLKWQI